MVFATLIKFSTTLQRKNMLMFENRFAGCGPLNKKNVLPKIARSSTNGILWLSNMLASKAFLCSKLISFTVSRY